MRSRGELREYLQTEKFITRTNDDGLWQANLKFVADSLGTKPNETPLETSTAYLQLGFVSLFVLLGALLAAEKLIIRPIQMMAGMAKRFGQGDWSVRAARNRLPAEFVPLARAFNAMAAQLAERERELVATNERLTVIASIDMLSGLSNRRGFQSRLDYRMPRIDGAT
jgi:methyl-accepting chemotaxis protein